MNQDRERKPGTRVPPNILTIIVAVLIIAGTLIGWGFSYSALSKDIEYLKEDITELKASHSNFTNINEKLGEINVRLGKIETTLSMDNK